MGAAGCSTGCCCWDMYSGSGNSNGNGGDNDCHDLAKWLSYYLYLFSFSFLLIRKSMDVQEEMTQKRCVGLYK